MEDHLVFGEGNMQNVSRVGVRSAWGRYVSSTLRFAAQARPASPWGRIAVPVVHFAPRVASAVAWAT